MLNTRNRSTDEEKPRGEPVHLLVACRTANSNVEPLPKFLRISEGLAVLNVGYLFLSLLAIDSVHSKDWHLFEVSPVREFFMIVRRLASSRLVSEPTMLSKSPINCTKKLTY